MAMSAEDSSTKGPLAASLRSAFFLGVFALIGATLVAGTYHMTRAKIAKNEQELRLRSLNEILAPDEYDNDLLSDTVSVDAPAVGGEDGRTMVHRARKDGQPVAVIMEVVAPDGYSGAIRMLVGIYTNGQVAGVRVVSHRETPGLGDDIDLARSNWVLEFEGKSLESPATEAWTVKRDGGEFDQFTGATITPRAVVKAVRGALIFYRTHQTQLLTATTL